MTLRTLGEILMQAGRDWLDDNAPRMGAALAFYAIFAIAPLLVICTAIVGLIYERDAAEGQILTTATELVGDKGADALKVMLESAARPQVGYWATVAGIATMALAALGFFGELQAALNVVWNTKPRADAGWIAFLRVRVISTIMVLLSAVVLVGLLFASTAMSTVSSRLWIFEPFANSFVTLLIMALLFAMIYRVLPDAEIGWSDVWLGSIVTALLFAAGNYAIGLYLARGTVSSAYGAAGSLAVLLAWFYYAAQVFLLGAEITHAYARRQGSSNAPSPLAEVADPEKS